MADKIVDGWGRERENESGKMKNQRRESEKLFS